MSKGSSYNGQMAIRGGGSRLIRCTDINYGLDIIATADNESRTRRSFYSISTEESDFSITLGFISWEERESVNRWLHDWQMALINDRAGTPFVTVSVPSRNFLRTAVLSGEIGYGEGWADIVYVAQFPFVAASNPVTGDMANAAKFISQFKSGKDSAVTNTFYPAGIQVSGAESLDAAYYNPAPTPVPPLPNPLDRFGLEMP